MSIEIEDNDFSGSLYEDHSKYRWKNLMRKIFKCNLIFFILEQFIDYDLMEKIIHSK